jgi:hyaluronan synthase
MYRALRSDGVWKYALLATFFYVSFSLQLVWAIARIRDGKWGTRAEEPAPPQQYPEVGLEPAPPQQYPEVGLEPA